MSFLKGTGSLTSGGVSGDISKPGVAFAATGAKNSDEGGSFVASGGIQFTTAAITPVPEPTSYALAFFGLAFGLSGAGRVYLSRRLAKAEGGGRN